MCGIAGILYRDRSAPVNAERLTQMAAQLVHRGPDAGGIWRGSGIGLAHRRLSIIDLAGGDQPIGNEDDSIQVVFNGEIYNYPELRRALIQRGHQFKTSSDTEVLVHLYEDEGVEMVNRLRGMFGFAIWDSRAGKLTLGRDRLGQKPLYYYQDDSCLLFGSELKAILADGAASREIDQVALEDYFTYGFVPYQRSIFRQIRKLPAAHTLQISWDQWSASPRRYWQLNMQPDESRSLEEWLTALDDKFKETVRAHLIADVPVGAFLSGGIDSSGVVAALAEQGQKVQTFSIGFEERRFSELPYAREVAHRYGLEHTEEIVMPSVVDLLDAMVWHYDEPFADPSAIPTMCVSQVARQHVKVILSGDGGDEAFGGYARYAHDLKEASIRAKIPAWLRHRGLCKLARVWPKADWLPRVLRLKTALTNLSLDPDAAYANTLSICRPPIRQRLLKPDLRLAEHQPERLVREAFVTDADDPLRGMIAADIAVMLPDDFLTKVDRASMAVGLEVRPPLVDHELLELAARIPSRWKICNGETKFIFKQLLSKSVPNSILDRPKQGFDIPVDQWLRGPLREMFESSVLDRSARIGDFIDQSVARSLYQTHQRGLGRHGNVLWSLLIFGRWAEKHLASPSADPFLDSGTGGETSIVASSRPSAFGLS